MALGSSHKSRVYTGLVLAALVILCLVFGGAPLRLLLAVTAVAALYEFYNMFWPGFSHLGSKVVGLGVGLGVVLFARPGGEGMALFFALLGLAWFFTAMKFLFSYGTGNDEARLEQYAIMPVGILYIPLTLQIVLHLTVYEQLIVLLAAVASDVGAYYAGSLLGKTKLWPKISPNKSREGAVGGLLCCVALVTALGLTLPMPEAVRGAGIFTWIALAIALNLASLFGDLFESALKRVLQVKDSSNLLPGHGGVLDRVDSLIFVLPVYAFFRFFIF